MRARTVLWMKPPRFDYTQVRSHLAMLLDIPVTLRAALGLPLGPHDGLDLLGHESPVYDARKLYYHGRNGTYGHFFAHRDGGRGSQVPPGR